MFAVIGSFLAGPPPPRDDAAEIAEWFVDNDSAIQTGAFLAGIGVIGLVWLAQAGLVVVAANLLSGVGVPSDAAFWGLLGFIAFLAFAVWTVVVSLHLYQNVPADG